MQFEWVFPPLCSARNCVCVTPAQASGLVWHVYDQQGLLVFVGMTTDLP
jgi:hypothetical protein